MAGKREKPEDIVMKLRQFGMLVSQDLLLSEAVP